ncbi:Pentatricopeptide repeat-containing protein, mitochondrial [Glycine soja]
MGENGVQPNVVTFNTLINGFCKERKRHEANRVGDREMVRNGVKADILTINALILGLCKDGKTKKAAGSMVRSGYSPNEHIFQMLISAFYKNEDFDGDVQVLRDMLGRLMSPDLSTLSELCDGLCRCGKNQLALALCSVVEEASIA